MPNGRDAIAQGVYLAQLEAVRGNCKCNTCRILRKASRMMTREFLKPSGDEVENPPAATDIAQVGPAEALYLSEEDE